MSANDHTSVHEEAHSGPIKTPKQLLAAVFFSFVVPIFAIIGLVYYVTSADRTAPGATVSEKAIAQRIQKVGLVEIRDANRPLKTGEEVYKGQCVACHGTGAAGAPKFGDVAAWAPRLKTGFEALWNSALKGKGAMPPQAGGDFNDTEIARAVVYMTAAAGGKFPEPAVPAAGAPVAAAAGGAGAQAAAAAPPADVVAALAAANKSAAPAAGASGAGAAVPALYAQVCVACHATGVANAPKFGDKAAWAPRIAAGGVDALTASAIKGKGAMPPKGGSAASEADIKTVVQYMVNAAK
jgi:cytochrome c5